MKRKLSGLIIGITLILSIFIGIDKVKATTVSTSSDAAFQNVNKVTTYTCGVERTTASDASYMYAGNVNTPLYCVEYGTPFQTGDYSEISINAYFTNNNTYNTSYRVISDSNQEIQAKIALIGYYGYGYNTERTTAAYYFATQAMIFETIYGEGTGNKAVCREVGAPDDACPDDRYDTIASVEYVRDGDATFNSAVVAAKAAIKASIDTATTKPTFSTTDKAKLSSLNVGQTITITDTAGVLESFTASATDSKITISKYGNTLSITGVAAGTSGITLTKNNPTKTVSCTNRAYVLNGNPQSSQSLASPCGGPSVNDNLVVTILTIPTKGNIEISKTDISTSEPIPNTLITLYKEDGTKINEGRTDENGLLVFSALDDGKYYFVESEAADGYILNDEPHHFEITNGNTVKSAITNTKVDVPVTADLPIIIVIIVGLGGLTAGILYYQKQYGNKPAADKPLTSEKNVSKAPEKTVKKNNSKKSEK
ncbi:MAG: SpaA isopeptide-forming pilin-related protein [bacterium]|nr:SpaA isopeptide-forming pilin-related protein [bacterium]